MLLGVGDHAVEEAPRDRGGPRRPGGRGVRLRLVSTVAGRATARSSGSRTRRATAGMALCGAGCMGFVNVARGLRAIGYLERRTCPPGRSRSCRTPGRRSRRCCAAIAAIGFSLAVSSGQELVTTTADYLDYALELDETRVVALLLETVREPERLRAALDRAATRDVPVVLLAVGGTPAGARPGQRALGCPRRSRCGMGGTGRGARPVARRGPRRDGRPARAARRGPTRRAPRSRRRAYGHRDRARLRCRAGARRRRRAPARRAVRRRSRHGRPNGSPPCSTPACCPATRSMSGAGVPTPARCSRPASTALADDPAVSAVALAVDLVEEYDGDESYPARGPGRPRRDRASPSSC